MKRLNEERRVDKVNDHETETEKPMKRLNREERKVDRADDLENRRKPEAERKEIGQEAYDLEEGSRSKK
jgi:hypothetical protein